MAGLSFERYDELIREDLARRVCVPTSEPTTSKSVVVAIAAKKRRATIAHETRSRQRQGSSIPPFSDQVEIGAQRVRRGVKRKKTRP